MIRAIATYKKSATWTTTLVVTVFVISFGIFAQSHLRPPPQMAASNCIAERILDY